jgi:hypothetical protein
VSSGLVAAAPVEARPDPIRSTRAGMRTVQQYTAQQRAQVVMAHLPHAHTHAGLCSVGTSNSLPTVRLGLWDVCMRRHRPFLCSRLKGGAGEGCAVELRLSGPAGSSLRQLGVLREVAQCLQASTGGTG